MELNGKEMEAEPKWFAKWKRNVAKWFIKQTLRLLYFLLILLLIVVIFMFLITHLSWEKIIRFFLESGQFVTERFFAIFNTTQGA